MAREIETQQSTDLSRRALLFGRKCAEDESGATAIEYGLMAALIALGMLVGARRLGRKTNRKYRCMSRRVNQARRGRKKQAARPCKV